MLPYAGKTFQFPKVTEIESNLYRWKILDQGRYEGDSFWMTQKIPTETTLKIVPMDEHGEKQLKISMRTTLMNGDLNEIEVVLKYPFFVTSYRNTVKDLRGNILKESIQFQPDTLSHSGEPIVPAPLIPIALRATRFQKHHTEKMTIAFGDLLFQAHVTPVQRLNIRTPLGKFRCYRLILGWESTDWIPSPFFFRWLNESLLPVMEYFYTTQLPHRWVKYDGPYPGPSGPRLQGELNADSIPSR